MDQSISSMPYVLREKLEQEIREYGDDVLSWAICGEASPSDNILARKLTQSRELIEEQGGWNLMNPMMIAAEYGNKSKL